MKMMLGAFSLAIEKSWLTSFSDSPIHLETRSLLLTAKKVLSASVATALARYDLPVPGGPYSRNPLHALRLPGVAMTEGVWRQLAEATVRVHRHGCVPVKNCGNLTGKMTASFNAALAESRPATSSH